MYGKRVEIPAHLAHLRDAISEAPPGHAQRRARWALADAFVVAAQPEEALTEYRVAIEEAEAAGEQDELAAMLHDAAHAACDAGCFEMARAWYQRSVACEKIAGGTHLARMARELEMARMDILRGLWFAAEEIVKRHLHELRSMWQRRDEGITAGTGPQHEELKRVFLGALDIARQLAMVLEPWSKALELLDEMDALLVDTPVVRRRVRLSRIDPLLETSRRLSEPSVARAQVNEARQIAMECIASFQEAGAVGDEAQTYALLARIEGSCGNYKEAVSWAQRGFSLAPAIVDPWNRVVMHDNMAVYCHNAGNHEEAGTHWLVAVIIRIAAGFSIQPSKLSLRERRRSGRDFVVCCVQELVECPGYGYVKPFLHRLGTSVETVQAVVDSILGKQGGAGSGVPASGVPSGGAPAEVWVYPPSACRAIFIENYELPTHPGLQPKDDPPDSRTRRTHSTEEDDA